MIEATTRGLSWLAFRLPKSDWWDELTLPSPSGSDQELKFRMYAGPTQEWFVHSVSFPEKVGIRDSLQASALRIYRVNGFLLRSCPRVHFNSTWATAVQDNDD